MSTMAELPSYPCCSHSLNIAQRKLLLQEFRNMLVEKMLADKPAYLPAWSHSNWLHSALQFMTYMQAHVNNLLQVQHTLSTRMAWQQGCGITVLVM